MNTIDKIIETIDDDNLTNAQQLNEVYKIADNSPLARQSVGEFILTTLQATADSLTENFRDIRYDNVFSDEDNHQ